MSSALARPGHNRSYRQQNDRIATVRFTRYCGHRPSTVRGVEIPKAAARSLSMPKTRRPSAAHDVELALPTQPAIRLQMASTAKASLEMSCHRSSATRSPRRSPPGGTTITRYGSTAASVAPEQHRRHASGAGLTSWHHANSLAVTRNPPRHCCDCRLKCIDP